MVDDNDGWTTEPVGKPKGSGELKSYQVDNVMTVLYTCNKSLSLRLPGKHSQFYILDAKQIWSGSLAALA